VQLLNESANDGFGICLVAQVGSSEQAFAIENYPWQHSAAAIMTSRFASAVGYRSIWLSNQH
jgi:hypothetical protein